MWQLREGAGTGNIGLGEHAHAAPDDDGWDLDALPSLPAAARAIARSDARDVCAALADGTTRCLDDEGQWRAVAGMRDVVQLSGVGSTVCGVTSKGEVMCRNGGRAIEVPGITTARRIANPYVELADGSVVEIAYASRWTVKPKPAWAGITGIETGGYAWSPTCGVKNGRAHCWSAFGSSNDPLGRLGRRDAVRPRRHWRGVVLGERSQRRARGRPRHEATRGTAGRTHRPGTRGTLTAWRSPSPSPC